MCQVAKRSLPAIGGSGERVVVEAEPAHEGQRRQPVRLTHDLRDERARIPAPRLHEHAHARAESPDRIGERQAFANDLVMEPG